VEWREVARPHVLRALQRLELGARAGLGGAAGRAVGVHQHATPPSEKDPKLARKLGQLQPFVAVFPQECVGQLASFGPT
jgi:hypothetical protein